MKRLGKFSGRIYSDDEIKNMTECGICISDQEAEEEDYIRALSIAKKLDCLTCMHCPTSKGEHL